jgi:hypothetical protein
MGNAKSRPYKGQPQVKSFPDALRLFGRAARGDFIKKSGAEFDPYAKFGDRVRTGTAAARKAGRKYDNLYGDYMADGSYKPHDYKTMRERISFMPSGSAKKAMQYHMKRHLKDTSSWRSM